MLLEALVACAGVSFRAVSTAFGMDFRGGTVTADGDLDFRGTMGIDKKVPVGFFNIRLNFEVDTDASEELLAKVLKVTERYCVVLQTIMVQPEFTATISKKTPKSEVRDGKL